jgi:hypothetical protein
MVAALQKINKFSKWHLTSFKKLSTLRLYKMRNACDDYKKTRDCSVRVFLLHYFINYYFTSQKIFVVSLSSEATAW